MANDIRGHLTVLAGKKLKDTRVSLGMTQNELASLLGTGGRMIRSYENGTVSMTLDRLEEISRILHVSPISLLI